MLDEGRSFDIIEFERKRIRTENKRRESEVPIELYAPWNPGEIFANLNRKRRFALELQKKGIFPTPNSKCLEIGCGKGGWLPELISWGIPEKNLSGIDLDEGRVKYAQNLIPVADLRVGDASDLPWANNTFDLIILSTVFSSILIKDVRQIIADEVVRVLKPGGGLIWYDLAVNNPRNENVKKCGRKEIKELFPSLKGSIKSLTLAPPLARSITPVSWTLACLLEAIPFLRTHLFAVLIKQNQDSK